MWCLRAGVCLSIGWSTFIQFIYSFIHSFIHSLFFFFFFCIFARSTKTNFYVVIQSSISYSCINATAAATSKQSFGNLSLTISLSLSLSISLSLSLSISLSLERPMMMLLVARTIRHSSLSSIASQSALSSLSFTLSSPPQPALRFHPLHFSRNFIFQQGWKRTQGKHSTGWITTFSPFSLSVLQIKKRLHDEGPAPGTRCISSRSKTNQALVSEEVGSLFNSLLFFMGGLYLGRKDHAQVCRLTVFQTRPASWAARFSFLRSPAAQKSSLSKSSQSLVLTTMDRARSCCVCTYRPFITLLHLRACCLLSSCFFSFLITKTKKLTLKFSCVSFPFSRPQRAFVWLQRR